MAMDQKVKRTAGMVALFRRTGEPDELSYSGHMLIPPINRETKQQPPSLYDISEEQECLIYDLMEAGHNLVDACRMARVDVKNEPNTDWARNFVANMQEAEARSKDTALRTIMNSFGTDWRAAKWFLEVRFPKQFAPAAQAAAVNVHTGGGDATVEIYMPDNGRNDKSLTQSEPDLETFEAQYTLNESVSNV
jgi:hypothetical protein